MAGAWAHRAGMGEAGLAVVGRGQRASARARGVCRTGTTGRGRRRGVHLHDAAQAHMEVYRPARTDGQACGRAPGVGGEVRTPGTRNGAHFAAHPAAHFAAYLAAHFAGEARTPDTGTGARSGARSGSGTGNSVALPAA